MQLKLGYKDEGIEFDKQALYQQAFNIEADIENGRPAEGVGRMPR